MGVVVACPTGAKEVEVAVDRVPQVVLRVDADSSMVRTPMVFPEPRLDTRRWARLAASSSVLRSTTLCKMSMAQLESVR
jgi:hypothetical protein